MKYFCHKTYQNFLDSFTKKLVLTYLTVAFVRNPGYLYFFPAHFSVLLSFLISLEQTVAFVVLSGTRNRSAEEKKLTLIIEAPTRWRK